MFYFSNCAFTHYTSWQLYITSCQTLVASPVSSCPETKAFSSLRAVVRTQRCPCFPCDLVVCIFYEKQLREDYNLFQACAARYFIIHVNTSKDKVYGLTQKDRDRDRETHYLQYGGALLLGTWKWMSEPLCVLSAWPQFKPSKISCVLQRRCQGPHPWIPTVIELWIRVGLQEMHVWDLEGEWENTLFSWGSIAVYVVRDVLQKLPDEIMKTNGLYYFRGSWQEFPIDLRITTGSE